MRCRAQLARGAMRCWAVRKGTSCTAERGKTPMMLRGCVMSSAHVWLPQPTYRVLPSGPRHSDAVRSLLVRWSS
jgi:hypothetical protein